jgi:hypothetical protein
MAGFVLAQEIPISLAGLIAVVIPIGVVAAVPRPTVEDSAKRAAMTDAVQRLRHLAKAAEVHYVMNSAFPVADVPLTPSMPCCDGPGHSCVTPDEVWQQPIWQKLSFRVERPSLFQYSYQSDGRTYFARAVGDPDCSGHPITYELQGSTYRGDPVFSLVAHKAE